MRQFVASKADGTDLVLLEGPAQTALTLLPAESVDLVLTDPPWNTGATQTHNMYAYRDTFYDFGAFLRPVFLEMHRVLKSTGTCIVHMGTQEAHHVRVWLEEIFGEQNFQVELIAHHEVGRGPVRGWACKHSHLLVFCKRLGEHAFNAEAIRTVERKAQKLGLPDTKKANSVLPATLSTTDSQRVGYPSQKSLSLYQMLIEVHSNPLDVVLDPFCGSGTTGDAARRCGRSAVLIDNNPAAVDLVSRRLELQQK